MQPPLLFRLSARVTCKKYSLRHGTCLQGSPLPVSGLYSRAEHVRLAPRCRLRRLWAGEHPRLDPARNPVVVYSRRPNLPRGIHPGWDGCTDDLCSRRLHIDRCFYS